MNTTILVFPDGKRIKYDSIAAYDTISNTGKDLTIHTVSDTGAPYAYTFGSALSATIVASMIDAISQTNSNGNVFIESLSSLPSFTSIKWSTDGITWNNSPAPKNNSDVQIQVNGSNLDVKISSKSTAFLVSAILLTATVPPPYSTDLVHRYSIDSIAAASIVSKNRMKFALAANTYDLSVVDPAGNVLFTQGSAIVFS